jgi:hypothetical protein
LQEILESLQNNADEKRTEVDNLEDAACKLEEAVEALEVLE